MFHNKKGFTLIEMLVVIAIIAVLVSIIIPTVTAATTKAEAAADAANLRSTLGLLNTKLSMDGGPETYIPSITVPKSQMNPDAELRVLYTLPGFIKVYYVVGDNYYGLAYLSDVAENGSSTLPLTKPTDAGDWYIAGIGPVGP